LCSYSVAAYPLLMLLNNIFISFKILDRLNHIATLANDLPGLVCWWVLTFKTNRWFTSSKVYTECFVYATFLYNSWLYSTWIGVGLNHFSLEIAWQITDEKEQSDNKQFRQNKNTLPTFSRRSSKPNSWKCLTSFCTFSSAILNATFFH
jgi:hypothetical protein